MKKVLIITEVFPPAFNPRMGYLVKYLPEFGWNADIITQNSFKDNNFKFLVGSNRIVRVKVRHTDAPQGFMQKIWYFLNLKRYYSNNAKSFIKEMKLCFRGNDYSVIIVSVSSRDLFVLDAGFVISKKWDIPLVIDLRDISEQRPVLINNTGKCLKTLLLAHLQKSLEKKKMKSRNSILENAQAVTTVSPYLFEIISKYNSNAKLIYNGYDPDLYHQKDTEKTDTFYIIYTGLVFEENMQDPTLLFEAIKQLENDGIINTTSFRIRFYTPVQWRVTISNHRSFCDVNKYIDFFDYVDYHKVPELLQRSSIALVLANLSDKNGPKGVLTTKFFDYLGAERPVLCVRSDEDILEEVIKRTGIGIAARNVSEAYEFILEKWDEWKDKGFTTARIDQEYKQQFSRKAHAKQFADLLEEVSTITKF